MENFLNETPPIVAALLMVLGHFILELSYYAIKKTTEPNFKGMKEVIKISWVYNGKENKKIILFYQITTVLACYFLIADDFTGIGEAIGDIFVESLLVFVFGLAISYLIAIPFYQKGETIGSFIKRTNIIFLALSIIVLIISLFSEFFQETAFVWAFVGSIAVINKVNKNSKLSKISK
ncbi:hypothetical protein GLW08_21495 [Pontibacillus yanchengensis]|uniref:Uncharacterized protein n=2 Tax=Pontibacillus yanchengensis TaxID=462910 RepID=A0A6I5A727_9BACI|nr:hypothetical protein [Pontibacillus yanchengensis]MYL36133.1 hypothetical protein [Pontibacillus yanchengensis]MYL55879.1 hypothetical protein [Pontibacillus yanchengensis]